MGYAEQFLHVIALPQFKRGFSYVFESCDPFEGFIISSVNDRYRWNSVGFKKYDIIHIFSSMFRFLFLSDLKKEGVSPVIFLNWFDRCETLL